MISSDERNELLRETFRDRVADNDIAGAIEIVGDAVFKVLELLQATAPEDEGTANE